MVGTHPGKDLSPRTSRFQNARKIACRRPFARLPLFHLPTYGSPRSLRIQPQPVISLGVVKIPFWIPWVQEIIFPSTGKGPNCFTELPNIIRR